MQECQCYVTKAHLANSVSDEVKALESALDMCSTVCEPFHLELYKIRGHLLSALIVQGLICCCIVCTLFLT